ncbi:DUF3883 domain-containing protein [Leuconostoc mesenteroides]|uniref:DUF3883 domain-containing protein n=1 Tax=Leuconostoc mesenteroides TaxID=1245 RepID=UPI002361A3C5|nr:DUF3883 domain-containing protein [Leuconostoc mesenteroides]
MAATLEAQFRTAIHLLLEQYGSLTTTEIKDKIGEIVDFTEDDLKPRESRNGEAWYKQTIGNVISHGPKNAVFDVKNIYQVDKTKSPAVFTLLQGIGPTVSPILHDNIESRRTATRKFQPKKTDWNALQDDHGSIGLSGEEFVTEYERDRVALDSKDDALRVEHLSQTLGDGAGYDVLSLDTTDGSTIYIEVKTTTGNKNTPFYMTENERAYFELHHNDSKLFLYRVYDFDRISGTGEIEKISASELMDKSKFRFDSVNYKVFKL